LKELQQNNLKTVGLSLESYLIMPVQRFPRYVMLLQVFYYYFLLFGLTTFKYCCFDDLKLYKELMKNTPVVHDDWDSIRMASAKIKDLGECE